MNRFDPHRARCTLRGRVQKKMTLCSILAALVHAAHPGFGRRVALHLGSASRQCQAQSQAPRVRRAAESRGMGDGDHGIFLKIADARGFCFCPSLPSRPDYPAFCSATKPCSRAGFRDSPTVDSADIWQLSGLHFGDFSRASFYLALFAHYLAVLPEGPRPACLL